jgi:hypothetical protein
MVFPRNPSQRQDSVYNLATTTDVEFVLCRNRVDYYITGHIKYVNMMYNKYYWNFTSAL